MTKFIVNSINTKLPFGLIAPLKYLLIRSTAWYSTTGGTTLPFPFQNCPILCGDNASRAIRDNAETLKMLNHLRPHYMISKLVKF